jgi:predicted RNA-binding protein with EMAP domain
MPKREMIKKSLSEKYGLKDIRIKRTGEQYKITVSDIVTFEKVDEIKEHLQDLIGNYKDPKFDWLSAFDIHFQNVRFKVI